jgi:fatty acid desaturase
MSTSLIEPTIAAPSRSIAPEFSITQARSVVKDLFEPKAAIYWGDFLLSIGVGVTLFAAIENRGPFFGLICRALHLQTTAGQALVAALLFVVHCLAFYRAALFTHELVHLRDDSVRGFRVVWNLACGIPFLMPSFLYHTHVHHHVRRQYGTDEDGEYLPLAAGPRWKILAYLAQSLFIPAIAVFRFGLLTPLGWVSPGFRRFAHRHLSSMVIDPGYVRPEPTRQQLRTWRWQEAGCLLYLLTLGALLITQVLPWTWIIHAYSTGVAVILLNAVRTLGAHRYEHTGDEMSFVEQLLDSYTFPTNPLINELWAPVGLRFHALHHVFPSLPYHSLGKAHRRLMRHLPVDSPYRKTVARGLGSVLRRLWRQAGKTS